MGPAPSTFPVDVLREAAGWGWRRSTAPRTSAAAGCAAWTGSGSSSSSRSADPSVAAFISIHNMCAWMIDTFGTDDQRKAWMPRLASMEAIASYCLTEPGAGSDAAALRTKAVRRRRRLRARRRQAVHLRGGHLRRLRRDGPHRRERPRGISAFIVEKERRGSVSAPTRRRWAGTPSPPPR